MRSSLDPAELGREVDIAAGAAGDLRQSLALLLEDLQKNTSLTNQWNGFLAETRTSITAARPPLSLMATSTPARKSTIAGQDRSRQALQTQAQLRH